MIRSPSDILTDLIDTHIPEKYRPQFEHFLDTTNDNAAITAVIKLVKAGKIDAALTAISDDRLLKLAAALAVTMKGAFMSFVRTMQSDAIISTVEWILKNGTIDEVMKLLDSHLADLGPIIKQMYVVAGSTLAEDHRVALKGKPGPPIYFSAIADKARVAETTATDAVYAAKAAQTASIEAASAIHAAKDASSIALKNAAAASKAAEAADRSIRQAQIASAAIRATTGDVADVISAATKKAIKAADDATKLVDRATASAASSPIKAAQDAQKAVVAAQDAAKTAESVKQAAQAVDNGIRELRPSVGISFDPSNPRAAAQADTLTYNFIREISQEQRDAVRTAVTKALSDGSGPKVAARAFRDTIGLTEKQNAAVESYRTLLEQGSSSALDRALRDRRSDKRVARAGDDPLSPEQINSMVDRYRNRFIQYRADTIARTESTEALGSANHEAVQQTVAAADIDPATNVLKKWNSTFDDRTRESHVVLGDGPTVLGMMTPFVSMFGNKMLFPGDRSHGAQPRDIVNCRCVCSYRIIT